MRDDKLRPKVVLWWGVGLLIAGVVVEMFFPAITFGFVDPSGANGVDQGLLTAIDTAVRVASALVTPVGTALLGAGVVMAYLSKREAPLSAESSLQD